MKSNRIFSNILFLYLCLAPINWLPFLPLEVVNGTKYFLFVALIFFCVANDSNHKKVSLFFSFHYYVLIILCMLPAMLLAYSDIMTNLIDISFLFLMNYIIIQSGLTKDDLFRVFFKVAVFIGFIGLLSLLSAITGISITSPPPWDDSFSSAAFGGYRTGWSDSIFLYIPFLFYAYFFSNEKKWKVLSIIAISGIITSQILCGGRAGLIASLFTFLFFTRFKIRNVILLAVAAFLIFSYLGSFNIEKYFRATDQQLDSKEGLSNIDKISSGRISSYDIGWQLFKDSPIIGTGFGFFSTEISGLEIHNTWLKRLVDGGLIFVLPLVFLFIALYKKLIKNTHKYSNGSHHKILLQSLFFSAIFISQLEPNFLIGSFQGEAFFWAMVSTYLK